MAGRKLRRKAQRRKSRGGHYKRFRRQTSRFLNRYDFGYAGRDTVNQTMKGFNSLAPRLIKQTSDEVDRLAQHRIIQIIDEVGQQVERIAPKIIRGAIRTFTKLCSGYSVHLGETNCHRQKGSLTRQSKSSKNNV